MGCARYVTKQHLHQMMYEQQRMYEEGGIYSDYYSRTIELDRQAVSRAVTYYGEETMGELEYIYDDAPDYLNAITESLNEVADAGIIGMEEIVHDLAAGGATASGAEYELNYVLEHKEEIAEVAVPSARFRGDDSVYGVKGMDVLNKDGSAVELKNLNFELAIYKNNAHTIVEKVVKQAKDRVENHGATKVTISFASWNGPMPEEFRNALNTEIGSDTRITWQMG